ncbi:MAG: cupin domain-containing protein [Candidatus Rokuibacteriota bacterium]
MNGPASMIDRATAEHYAWGEGCDGWHLVQRADLSVIQERMPPGAREARHYHRASRQFFYVLVGTLTLEVDGRRHVMEARQGIEIEPGAPHQALNESAEAVEFLVVSQPPSHGDRVPAR